MTTVIVLPPPITIIITFDSKSNHNNDKDNYYHKENNDLDKKPCTNYWEKCSLQIIGQNQEKQQNHYYLATIVQILSYCLNK